jgi:hypothetical protein
VFVHPVGYSGQLIGKKDLIDAGIGDTVIEVQKGESV